MKRVITCLVMETGSDMCKKFRTDQVKLVQSIKIQTNLISKTFRCGKVDLQVTVLVR